nr:MAG TPA: hypothetical protein [Caudoviricetes sp.]
MQSQMSRQTLNRFRQASRDYQSSYINPKIVFKLKVLNAKIMPKLHTFCATVPGYYVEWFYNSNTSTYIFISGATNGTVFMSTGDLDRLCSEFERVFGYDV